MREMGVKTNKFIIVSRVKDAFLVDKFEIISKLGWNHSRESMPIDLLGWKSKTLPVYGYQTKPKSSDFLEIIFRVWIKPVNKLVNRGLRDSPLILNIQEMFFFWIQFIFDHLSIQASNSD